MIVETQFFFGPLAKWCQHELLAISNIKTRKNAIVEYHDYQIPVTQLKGPKGNGDMQAAKRD